VEQLKPEEVRWRRHWVWRRRYWRRRRRGLAPSVLAPSVLASSLLALPLLVLTSERLSKLARGRNSRPFCPVDAFGSKRNGNFGRLKTSQRGRRMTKCRPAGYTGGEARHLLRCQASSASRTCPRTAR
jgi:hypothetical protein